MPDHYNASSKEVSKAKWYQQRRQQLREELLKQQTNPFRQATGEGGIVMDTAYSRFMAMRTTGEDMFEATPKNVRTGLFFLIPLVGGALLFKKLRDEKELKFRTGQVAYKDRFNKLI